MEIDRHLSYMKEALIEAEQAAIEGEVPVGAMLVGPDGDILARGHNRPMRLNDPTGHAEILVLREAGSRAGNYRLPGHVVYVTLEPCVMCAGALLHARVAMVVYGAQDPKAGALESVYQIGTDGRLNHGFQVLGGVMAEESRVLLRAFFQGRRSRDVENPIRGPYSNAGR
jgi:tRNA(adenine34) deaminase